MQNLRHATTPHPTPTPTPNVNRYSVNAQICPYIINLRHTHALARVKVVDLSVRTKSAYTCKHLKQPGTIRTCFFTIYERFNMCAWSSIKTHGSKVMTSNIGRLCGGGEHKQVDISGREAS